MARQEAFLNGVSLGERQIPDWWDIGTKSTLTSSYHLFCGRCGRIWGKLIHHHPKAWHQIVTSQCREHIMFPSDGTFTLFSGCFGHPRDGGDYDSWPEAVLRHDLETILDFYATKKREGLIV